MRNSRLENEILQRVDELVQCAISVSLKDETARAEQLARGITMVQEMGDLLLEVLEGREQHLQALLEQLVAQRLPDRRILQSFGNFPRDIQHIISQGVDSYLRTHRKTGAIPEDDSTTASNRSGNDLPETEGQVGEAVIAVDAGNTPENGVSLPEPATALEQAPAPPVADGGSLSESAPATTLPEAMQGEKEKGAVAGTGTMPAAEPDAAVSHFIASMRLALLQAFPAEEIITNYEIRGGKIPLFLPRLQIGFEPAGSQPNWRQDFYCRQQGISIRRVAADELANPVYLARRLRREASWRQDN